MPIRIRLQWQRAERFYYSMPFPPLVEYVCTFALFNPYKGRSAGELTVFDPSGSKVITKRYELQSYFVASVLFEQRQLFPAIPEQRWGQALPGNRPESNERNPNAQCPDDDKAADCWP